MDDPGSEVPPLPAAAADRLLRLALALGTPRPLGPVLSDILLATTDLLACDRASLLLYDAAAERLRFVAATSEETEALAQIPVPLDGSLAGTIFRERRAIVVDDVATDTRHFREPGEALGYRPRAIAGVPMLVGDEAVGVLEALDPHAGTFADGAVDVLRAVAAQAAVAVVSARERHAAERTCIRLAGRDHLHAALLDAAARELTDAGTDAARVAAAATLLQTVHRHAMAPARRDRLPLAETVRARLATLGDGCPVLDLSDGTLHVHAAPDGLGEAIDLVVTAALGTDGAVEALDVCVDADGDEAQVEIRGPGLGTPTADIRLAAAALVAERDAAAVWTADGAAFVSWPVAPE